MTVTVTWNVTKYGNPYLELVLWIYPIQSAHTQQWTQTNRERTPGAGFNDSLSNLMCFCLFFLFLIIYLFIYLFWF